MESITNGLSDLFNDVLNTETWSAFAKKRVDPFYADIMVNMIFIKPLCQFFPPSV